MVNIKPLAGQPCLTPLAANFVFPIFLTILCWKLDVNESLGCSLEMCSGDVVVSQLHWFPFVRPSHRHHD